MFAILTLSSPSNEQGLALMACPAHALRGALASHLFSSGRMRHCQWIESRLGAVINSNASDGLAFALVLGGLARISRAFLATSVLAIAANSFGSKRCLAAVAGAVDSHTDLLLHPWCTICIRCSPLARLQSQPIFGEHGARLLLLHCTVLLRSHGRARLEGHRSRFAVLDDLGDLGRNR